MGVFRDVSNGEQFGEPKAPEMYVPFAQSPWPQAMVAIRTTTRPELLRSSLAAAVRTVDPALPLVDVRTMEQIVGERLVPDGFNIVLYGGLAGFSPCYWPHLRRPLGKAETLVADRTRCAEDERASRRQ